MVQLNKHSLSIHLDVSQLQVLEARERTQHSCRGTAMVKQNRAARSQVKADVASNAK